VSVESLAIALNHSKAKGSAKIIMMGIANHDGDGGAWPSIDTLAKYANVTRRNARDAIQRLVELGEIEVVLHGGGTSDSLAFTNRPNLYKVRLRCPADCDRTSQHRTSRRRSVQVDIDPGSLPTLGVAFDPHPGSESTPGSGSVATPEPSSKPTTRLNKERHHSARERECKVSPRISPTGEHVPTGTGHCLNCGAKMRELVTT